jgi:hypothetical protein
MKATRKAQALKERQARSFIRRDLLDLCEGETQSGAHYCFFALSIDTIYLNPLFL